MGPRSIADQPLGLLRLSLPPKPLETFGPHRTMTKSFWRQRCSYIIYDRQLVNRPSSITNLPTFIETTVLCFYDSYRIIDKSILYPNRSIYLIWKQGNLEIWKILYLVLILYLPNRINTLKVQLYSRLNPHSASISTLCGGIGPTAAANEVAKLLLSFGCHYGPRITDMRTFTTGIHPVFSSSPGQLIRTSCTVVAWFIRPWRSACLPFPQTVQQQSKIH